jgi:hypothetical protein
MTVDKGVSAQSAHAELGETLITVPEPLPLDGDGRSVRAPVAPTEEAAPDSPPAPVLVTWTELRGAWRVFASVEWLLRDRAGYFAEIRERRALGIKLRNMVISSAILFALYGLLMGVSNSWQQALASAVKLPGLFLITLLICLPTLYFLNLLFGSQMTVRQTAALVLTGINVTAALSLAFALITLTFWITVPDYSLFLLLNVGVLALMTWWGMRFLIQGMHHVQQGYLGVGRGRILLFWVLIFAFVGTQMAWAMRPFVGAPQAPFELIRESQGSFYTGVFYNLRNLLGF